MKKKALTVTWVIGKCRNCSKLGHKAAQCKPKKVKVNKFEVICNYCKKPGHSPLGMVVIAIYVDDCLTIGTYEAVKEVVDALKVMILD